MRPTSALAGLLLCAGSAAHADERILHFLSDVQIEPDASLEVTETIEIRAENERLNHGIYRDFPIRYAGRNGGQMRVGFKFRGATLDGGPVPATVEPVANGVRMKIGDPNKMIPVGVHSFVLRYRTTRQIGRFRDYDELYWNATGNGWIFPIDAAEARIRLPRPATFGQRAVYTGAQGSKASNAEVSSEAPGQISFRTTRPLSFGEGLTVAVAFPRGIVGDAPAGSRAAWWLSDYGPPAVGLLGLLALLYFYYVAWRRAGRNPRPGTVVPIFGPPDGLAPAGMRYVMRMAADNGAFAAALVDMGVQGHVRLVEEEGGWLSRDKRRIERLVSSKPLPEEEQAALDALCEPGNSVDMKQENHVQFAAAHNALDRTLKTKYEGKMFKRNLGWAGTGVLLFGAALWTAAAAIVAATGGSGLWEVGVTLGCIALAAVLTPIIQDASAVGKCLLSGIAFLAGSAAIAVGMPLLGEALNSGWWLPLLLPALALPLIISAFWWIAAPTPQGRALLDHIAGFKQYLSTAEGERLDRMTPPDETPELFEKYLPYAIALGVENRWASRFAGVLAAAAASGRQGFAWYSGGASPWHDPASFADSVGSSLSSTISSASAAPGSSSGSGGGGSSGGGGGGGGGGGW